MAQRDKRSNRPGNSRYLVLLLLIPALLALWAAIAGTLTYQDVNNLAPLCCANHNASGGGARAAGLALLNNYADYIASCDAGNCSTTISAAIVRAFATGGVFSSVFGNVVGRDNLTDYLDASGAQFPACSNITALRAVLWDFRTSTLSVELECTQFVDPDYLVQDRVALFRFDCSGLIVYQRSYYNAQQEEPLYPLAVTAPCNYCDCATEPQVGVQAHDAAQARLLARRQARNPRAKAKRGGITLTSGGDDATAAFRAFVPRQQALGHRHKSTAQTR